MSKVSTLEDVRKALSAVKGSTFHIDGGLVYIYHTIIHDENHPIDLRYSNTNLYIQIKQDVLFFCDHMKRVPTTGSHICEERLTSFDSDQALE